MSESILKRVYENRRKSSQINKEYRELKQELESLMESSGIDTLTDQKNNLIATRKKTSRETLPKSEIPVTIWDKYKKTTTTYTLTVKRDDD